MAHLQCRDWKKDNQYVDDRYSEHARRHSGTAEIIQANATMGYPGTTRLINTIPGMLSMNCAVHRHSMLLSEQSTHYNAGE